MESDSSMVRTESHRQTGPADADDLKSWSLDDAKLIHVEMGMQCNVRCDMCFQTEFGPKMKIADFIWKKELLPVYPIAEELLLIGGEPTVLPNCRELLEMVLRDYPGLSLTTATNGILFRGIWEEAFLRQDKYLNFSLNAITPELYTKLIQFGRQNLVMENIDRMVRRKRESGSRVTLRISMVITDETVDELPKFIAWAAEHGLDQVSLYADYLGRLGSKDPNQVRKKILEAHKLADEHPDLEVVHLVEFDRYYSELSGLPPIRPEAVEARAPGFCPNASGTIHISTDGNVKPCCPSWYIYGNLHRRSLEEVWCGERAMKFRQRILRSDYRDCWPACELNACPIDHRIARMRQGIAAFRNNPRTGVRKVLRKLGLLKPQLRRR
jgi:MoaA/NifB/PqqE/SkfB family radical SAM enzyme